jgi:hypothetical protein
MALVSVAAGPFTPVVKPKVWKRDNIYMTVQKSKLKQILPLKIPNPGI